MSTVQSTPPHIVGCQIAGGNTEEWFHFDLNAGYCRNAEKGFNGFLEKYYPGSGFSGLPDLSKLNRPGVFHNDEHLAKFLEYASFAVAYAIMDFAAVVKQETGGNVVVGTFYGYSLEVTNPLYGVHALKVLLNDKNIDFICSPCSYIGTRDSGSDWTEMFPADSVRLHGKMKAAATCTENGVTTYTAEFENELFEAQSQDKDDIAALSHSFTNYVSDNNATIEKDGTKTAKCDRCDATDSIPDDRNPGKEAVNEVIAKIDTIKAVTEDDAEEWQKSVRLMMNFPIS